MTSRNPSLVRTSRRWQATACAILLVSAWSIPARADDDALPPEQQQGEIRYRSGGIGSEESAALKAASGRYALSLAFSSLEAGHRAYESDVRVSLRTAEGRELLNALAEGPFMLVNLPTGTYTIVATARGEARSQTVMVVAGQHKPLSFSWNFAGPAAP